MTVFLAKKPHERKKKSAIFALVLSLFCLFTFTLVACKKKVEYFDYVSELRSNILLAQEENFSLRVYAVKKESPYAADGIPQESAPRLEVYFLAPDGDKTVTLSCEIDNRKIEGEMSFDNVKCEYYYYRTLDVSALSSVDFVVTYGEREIKMTAKSVLTEKTLSPKVILSKLSQEKKRLFSSMTDKYGFTGEIYLRLIYEDSPYYYVGVIDRQGKIFAFLMNAETGKILAEREG